MATIYTVYSGSLSGPQPVSTEDPEQALAWGLELGPDAFVLSGSGQGMDYAWTPRSVFRHTGQLYAAIGRLRAAAG